MTTVRQDTEQLSLLAVPSALGVNGTFSPNRSRPVHRWYPYLEGFSEDFVLALLGEFGEGVTTVHDPFAGTGTTLVVSAFVGLNGTYSEVNPFMRLVIETKTNGVRAVAPHVNDLAGYLSAVSERARENLPSGADAASEFTETFGDREYFETSRLSEMVAVRRAIAAMEPSIPEFRDFAQLALAAIAVDSSQLVRVGDVRYRKPKEMARRIESPIAAFGERSTQIVRDLGSMSVEGMANVALLADSALDEPTSAATTDLVITSPPYLNGTNYFRNTKLELWAAGYLEDERELGEYRTQAIAAGINNVSRRGREPRLLPYVEEVATQLDEVAYDRRIPELVRRYFSDAYTWLGNLHTLLRPGARALVDIGDSRFAGVLVKTDELLAKVGQEVGFDLKETRILRKRRSNDGSPLEQVLLVLERPVSSPYVPPSPDSVRGAAQRFETLLPHQEKPLSARNWGHGWHSLCSYQGKLKPAIAHSLVAEFTSPGEVVLDPMSGAGTIPLEACLQGRVGWGNDLQELGYILTQAKVGRGDPTRVLAVAEDLLTWTREHRSEQDLHAYDEFGMNGRVPEYFHEGTYREILAARKYIRANPVDSSERALVYASMLHILHGNRPYALSRRSHPVTPFKPGGPTEYRPLEPRLMQKINRTLGQTWPERATDGRAFNEDLFDLPFSNEIDAVITSPPFAASTRFSVANWMRLWMAGWEPSDFAERKEAFLEYRQRDSLAVYRDFFAAAHRWLKPGGRLIMHVGRNGRWNMAEELGPMAAEWFDVVHAFDESVVGREKFGIRDQGGTKSHQYLFMVRD
ncbi:MAG TPA: DNA methylase [Actinobacteria bacterium]|nr:DNA methylase [bacterium BMS3Bbin01]HDL41535.1 DNA methylase [Actinomycetota bacterium]